MFGLKKLISFCMFFPWLSACAGNGAYELMLNGLLKRNVPEIKVDSLNGILNDVILLDARELKEFEVSSLPKAIYVGYDHFDFKKIDKLPKNAKIVVYCSVGYRSEKITEKLIAKGFTNVSNLYGGIFDWVNSGYPVYHNNQITTNIHPYNSVWGKWLQKGDKVYR
jgi:rhodanese-related sulfurtransferase